MSLFPSFVFSNIQNCEYATFIHWLVDKHWLIPILTFMNSATVNIHMQTSVWTFTFEYILNSRFVGSYISQFHIPQLRQCHTVFQSSCDSCCPAGCLWGFWSLANTWSVFVARPSCQLWRLQALTHNLPWSLRWWDSWWFLLAFLAWLTEVDHL